MIKVKYNKSKILITGHSLFGESGADIVCASVSSIVITTINAIVRFDEGLIDYTEKEGYVLINIKKNSKELKVLIDNMIDLLKSLEIQYPENIKIVMEGKHE